MEEGQQTGAAGRYGILLLTLIATYLVSAVTHSRWGGAVHVAFVAAIGLLALRNARLRPGSPGWLAAAVLATAIAAGVCAASGNTAAKGAGDIWSGLMLLLTVLVIVDRVVRLDRVTAQSLYAALSAYLLIGLMFTEFFGAFYVLVSGPFFARRPAGEHARRCSTSASPR